MSRPDGTTAICGVTYTIRTAPLLDNFGECDHDELTITLDESMTAAKRARTLLHEEIHAILEQSGTRPLLRWDEFAEEAIVRAIETHLWHLGYRKTRGTR